MSELSDLKDELDQVRDQVNTIDEEMLTVADIRRVFGAGDDEDLAVAAKRFVKEAFSEKVNEDIAGGLKRALWASVIALFTGLGTYAANLWGGE